MSGASLAKYVHELARDAIAGKVDAIEVLRQLEKVTAKAMRGTAVAPTFTAAELAKAKRDYRIKHWGAKGNGKTPVMTCADPAHEPLRQMGHLVSITYETDKWGDPKGTHYEHDFSRPLPVLAYSSTGLVICGGGYKIEARGIVG